MALQTLCAVTLVTYVLAQAEPTGLMRRARPSQPGEQLHRRPN